MEPSRKELSKMVLKDLITIKGSFKKRIRGDITVKVLFFLVKETYRGSIEDKFIEPFSHLFS